jgi:hypothetical protein
MNEPNEGSGWNALKVLGFIVGLLGLVGFGVCGLCGLAISGGDGEIILLGVLGLAIAGLFLWMMIAIFRAVNRSKQPPP